MGDKQQYMVSLQVGDVPPTFYNENGQREIAYTQGLIRDGVVKQLFVSMNRRLSWMVVEAADDEALTAILDGFPLRPYFTVAHQVVQDVAATVRD